MEKIKPVSHEVRESLRQEYQQAVQQAEQSLAALWKDPNLNQGILRQVFWLEALAIEKKAYHGLYDAGLSSGAVFEEFRTFSRTSEKATRASCPSCRPPH